MINRKWMVILWICTIFTCGPLLSVSQGTWASETYEITSYDDFYQRLKGDVDQFQTRMVYRIENYDEQVMDLKRAYHEMEVVDPAAEFIKNMSANYTYGTHDFVVDVTYDFDGDTNFKLLMEGLQKADAVATKIFKPNMSDYEKVKAAHDYIIQNTRYDDAALAAADSSAYESENLLTAALVDGKAICGGYSWALKVLLDRANIKSQLVIGKLDGGNGGEPRGHAWNMVWLQGVPYHVDVTNDDLEVGLPSYGYFLVGDNVVDENHTWDRSKYPVCGDSSLEYYQKNKLVFGDTTSMVRLIATKLQAKVPKGFPTPFVEMTFKVGDSYGFDKEGLEGILNEALDRIKGGRLNYTYAYVIQGDIRYIKVWKTSIKTEINLKIN